MNQRRLKPWQIIVVLGSLTAIAPLTIDMYLPALPAITDDLLTTETSVQLTLTGTLLGLAIGQLLIGPLSDAFGRRRPLLAGLALHVVASLLCAVAPNIAVLGTMRVLQGLATAAATVVATAVVRDLYTGMAAAKVFSRLMLIIGMAPMLAPTLGGLVLTWTQWRGIFVVLALFGVVLGIVGVLTLPETLPAERRRRGGFGEIARGYGALFRDRTFVGLVLVVGGGMGAIFAYVAGASFVLQQQYGLSEQQFGLVFGAGALWVTIATQLNAKLLDRYAPRQLLTMALVGAAVVSLVLVLVAAVGPGGSGGLALLLLPLWAVLFAMGLTLPNAPALALSRHGETAGTAAAMLGAIQFGAGALTAPLVGALGSDGLAMTVVIAGSVIAALAVLLAVVRAEDLEFAELAPAAG